MDNLIGKITASLIEKDLSLPEGLVDRINDNIKPPEVIKPADVYIRAMYLISDQVNSYGGKFPVEEHDNIIELLVDCPVLVGHRKDSLPIARTFFAEKEQRDGRNWVKVYFYWLKNSEKGEDLRKNIDGGIYKECSISFIFSFPECSICGSDIRECRHRPFQKYDTKGGGQKEAYFNYRQVENVLEVSLVYRGSVHDTSITRELFVPLKSDKAELSADTTYNKYKRYRIWDLSCLDDNKDYAVMPVYEALDVILEKKDDEIRLLNADGTTINNDLISKYLNGVKWPAGDYVLECRLIGYRGKSRLPVYELVNLLNNHSTAVRRVEIKIYDLLSHDEQSVSSIFSERRFSLENVFAEFPKRLVPVNMVNGGEVERIINQSGVRYGFEIVDCESSVKYSYTRRKIVPLQVHAKNINGTDVHYHLHGYSGREHLHVSAAVSTDMKLSEGELVEVEVYSLHREGNVVKLINPKIVDVHSTYAENIDIAYLLESKPQRSSSIGYTVYEKGNDEIAIEFDDDVAGCFVVQNYAAELVNNRRRLLIESISKDDVKSLKVFGSGTVVKREVRGSATLLHLRGFFDGRFVLKHVLLNGRDRHIFYRLDDGKSTGGTNEA